MDECEPLLLGSAPGAAEQRDFENMARDVQAGAFTRPLSSST